MNTNFINQYNLHKVSSIFLITLATFSYFFGFYSDENSAGAGSYSGDITIIWNNVKIFLTNDIVSSIHHEDYYSSRTPLVYILHKVFNPFTDNIINFRKSVFIISLTSPILFFFCLKQKFKKEDSILLFLISSIIFLSPYYRTSGYWGLEENFGYIFLLLSFLSVNTFLKNDNKNGYKVHFLLFMSTFFSSCCLYFDQKLIIIPLICFLTIITSNKLLKFKLFAIFYYLLFSSPYIYLIILWGGLIPVALLDLSTGRKLGTEIFLIHIGYATTMIGFYLFPLLFFRNMNVFKLIKNFFFDKKNYFFAFLFIIYIVYLIGFFDFNIQSDSTTNIHNTGKGFIDKISQILFEDNILKLIFVYSSFFISWIIILIFIENKLIDVLTIIYLLILSIFISPIYQEYFDPLIIILAFTFFNSKIYPNYKNSTILFIYFSIFLVSANIYYSG